MKALLWLMVFLAAGGIILLFAWLILLDRDAGWILPVWLGVIIASGAAGAFAWDNYRSQIEAHWLVSIDAHRLEWGDAICDYLIASRRKMDESVTCITGHVDEWGPEACYHLLHHDIRPGMTGAMVRATLGPPAAVDNEDLTAYGRTCRWAYGTPNHGAAYIWFNNDQVTRVQQS